MKILILGGRGMAGHMIRNYMLRETGYHVFFTTRDPCDLQGLFLDVTNMRMVENVMELVRPDVVINAVGVLNEQAARNEGEAFQINGLLPHHIRRFIEKTGGRLIHISTDCVFSGERGGYEEGDLPDGISIYARSKAMGEVRSPKHLTVRTSIIGPEVRDNGIGLFQWFMKQQGVVNGYTHVFWNGVTTLQLAKSLVCMIDSGVTGLYHLTAPGKVSKYELLQMIQTTFGKRDVKIIPYDAIRLDRSIKNTRTDFQHDVPALPVMLQELRDWMEGDG